MNILADGNKEAYGIRHFLIDDETELPKIEIRELTPGSTVFAVETSQYFILNSKKEWKKIANYGSGGSGGGGTGPSDPHYDGGWLGPNDPNVSSGPGYDGGWTGPESQSNRHR